MFDTYHIHLEDKKLNQILKLLKMGQETLNELTAKVDTANAKADAALTSISAIREDITDIKNGLPTEGGLTAEEVATLRTKLDDTVTKNTGVADAAAALDAENPEA